MGHEELIAALRKEGGEKVDSIRKAAEAEADTIRTETAGRLETLREDYKGKELLLTRSQEEDIVASAEKKARIILLSAEKALSERLFHLSRGCLHELRMDGYESIFAALVNEIPAAGWEEVRVHPADAVMAREYFPESGIVTDEHISGGFEAAAEKGRRHVINTFEKRLERGWEEILPLLVIDTYREVSRHGTAESD